MAVLAAQARAAVGGLVRLVRGDAGWVEGFDLDLGGFWRSFAGPLLAAPLYVVAVALVESASDARSLWSAGLAQLLDAVGFTLLLAVIAGPMRFKAGFAAFVTVSNWAALYLNLTLTACALLALLGPDGKQAFNWASLLLLGLSVLVTWRIARETLSRELAPVVLVVVLSLAWGVLADAAAGGLVGG